MTQFSFTLIGTNQPLIIDIEASDLAGVADVLSAGRFVQGDVVAHTGELTRALIPVSRIQFVAEMTE
jgi:hypothetical protein